MKPQDFAPWFAFCLVGVAHVAILTGHGSVEYVRATHEFAVWIFAAFGAIGAGLAGFREFKGRKSHDGQGDKVD